MKFPTDSKGNVVVEWDKQNERYQWTRDITHEFIVFPPSCNSYVTIYPPNDTPKSDLPPGAVRLDSLKWDDIFSLSDIIDPYTLRVVVHRRCCPEGDSRPFSHKYQGTTYDLTGHDPSTPVYPVEATFALKGEEHDFNVSGNSVLISPPTPEAAALKRWWDWAIEHLPYDDGSCVVHIGDVCLVINTETHEVAFLGGKASDLISWAHAELKRRGFGRITTDTRYEPDHACVVGIRCKYGIDFASIGRGDCLLAAFLDLIIETKENN